MAGETDGGRLVLMSTHGPGSSRNARESLATPRDLTRIADRLDSAAVGRPDAFVWAFKSGTSVMRADEPLRPGDVTVTTSKVGREVVVERLFPVLAVLRDQPDVAGLLGINWRGDPESLAQLKSLTKKATKATIPVYSHTLWLASNSGLTQEWEDIQGLCADVFGLVPEAEYADDPDDFNSSQANPTRLGPQGLLRV